MSINPHGFPDWWQPVANISVKVTWTFNNFHNFSTMVLCRLVYDIYTVEVYTMSWLYLISLEEKWKIFEEYLNAVITTLYLSRTLVISSVATYLWIIWLLASERALKWRYIVPWTNRFHTHYSVIKCIYPGDNRLNASCTDSTEKELSVLVNDLVFRHSLCTYIINVDKQENNWFELTFQKS